jgi:hypothetical protein
MPKVKKSGQADTRGEPWIRRGHRTGQLEETACTYEYMRPRRPTSQDSKRRLSRQSITCDTHGSSRKKVLASPSSRRPTNGLSTPRPRHITTRSALAPSASIPRPHQHNGERKAQAHWHPRLSIQLLEKEGQEGEVGRHHRACSQ